MLDQLIAWRDQGVSYSEAGRRLGISRSAAIGRVWRADQRLTRAAQTVACEARQATLKAACGRLISGDPAERGRYLDRLIWRGIETRCAMMLGRQQ